MLRGWGGKNFPIKNGNSFKHSRTCISEEGHLHSNCLHRLCISSSDSAITQNVFGTSISEVVYKTNPKSENLFVIL